MAHITLRERVRHLRREGQSINDIAHRTGTSKSTVSYWCRDIALSPAHMRALAQKSLTGGRLGILRAAEKKRASRHISVEKQKRLGARDIGDISRRDLFILGIGLYWGEGYKSGNDECGLTNSNPAVIRAFIRWLKETYDIPTSDLILRVSVNSIHRQRVAIIERYWSGITGVSRSQFTKASLIKVQSRKRYKDIANHFGTLRVKIRRGTALRRRILGSIEEATKQITQ